MRKAAAVMAVLAAVLPAASARAAGNAAVEARVDRMTMALGETLSYTLSISADVDAQPSQVKLPDFQGFQDMGHSTSEQISMSFGTGGRGFNRTKNITVTLSPVKTGEFEIGSARVTISGRRYESQPIRITVLPASKSGQAQPQRQAQQAGRRFPSMWDEDFDMDSIFGRPRQIGRDDVILRAGVDKSTVYEGEQVVYVVQLLSLVPLRGIDSLTLPKFDAFWAEDITSPQKISAETKVINGVPYSEYILKRKGLFPLKAGRFVFEAASVQASLGTSVFSPGQRLARASSPVEINVRMLPETGKPAGFNPENVGQFTFKAELSAPETTTDQPVTAKFIVAGTGNIKSVQIPKLQSADFRIFDPAVSDKVNTTRFRFAGEKTWEYLLVPRHTGRIEIPPLQFEYFDPVKGAYERLESERLFVNVRQGSGAPPSIPGSVQADGQTLVSGGMRPIRYTSDLKPSGPPQYRRWWFALLAAAMPAAWLSIAVFQTGRSLLLRQTPVSRQKRAHAAASRKLRKAETMLKGGQARPDAFYSELSRALTGYLSDWSGSEMSGLTLDRVREVMRAGGFSDELTERTAAEIEKCDFARFAPGTSDAAGLRGALESVRGLLLELERSR